MEKIKKVGAFLNALFGGLFASKSEKAFQWSNPQEDEFFYGPVVESHPETDSFFFNHLSY